MEVFLHLGLLPTAEEMTEVWQGYWGRGYPSGYLDKHKLKH